MSKPFIDLQDDLNEMKTQLKFLLRAFAVLATKSLDKGLRPTGWEAYQGNNPVRKLWRRWLPGLRRLLRRFWGRLGSD